MASLTLPTIACCLCGTSIQPNGANMCAACLSERYKITEPLDNLALDVLMCKRCGMFRAKVQGKNESWIHAEHESLKLMRICLKSVETILSKSNLKLTDSHWVWTEPHSRRLKVRIRVSKTIDEFAGGVVLESFKTLEWKINTRQCPTCASENASGGAEPWRALIQLRQRVDHKRTMAFLDQEIMKSGLANTALGIQQLKDGIDIYFADVNEATRLSDWIRNIVPARVKTSKKLISNDLKSNKQHMKVSIAVEVVPVCKYDLLHLGVKSSKISGTLLVTKVSSTLHLMQIHPFTLRTFEITSDQYWKAPFTPIYSVSETSMFTVLALEELAGGGCEVQVARSGDVGVEESTFTVSTHLTPTLLGEAGDYIMGYDLVTSTLDADVLSEMPSVVLVKKPTATEVRDASTRAAVQFSEEGHSKPLSAKQKRAQKKKKRREEKASQAPGEAAAEEEISDLASSMGIADSK